MSRLAEIYGNGRAVASSVEIATERNLPKPLVAKLLTVLSQAGLITGTPGPGGGYRLSRPPREISLMDIAILFERAEEADICPFAPAWCGKDPKCPLHEQLTKMYNETLNFLTTTRLDVFVKDLNAEESGSAKQEDLQS